MNFALQSFLSYKALTWVGAVDYISYRLLRPILFVTMFALVGRFSGRPGAAETYVIGMAIVGIPASMLEGVLPMLSRERNLNTLSALFASGVSRAAIPWTRVLPHFLNAMGSVTMSLLFGRLVLDLDLSRLDYPALVACILAVGASATGFAVFAGNFSLVLRASRNLADLMQGLIIALTGAIIPLASLPAPARWLSDFLPLTATLPAVRAAFTGAGLDAVAPALIRELAVAVAYAALGTATFVLFEREARRVGSLEWEPA